jgi:hypothetical protein
MNSRTLVEGISGHWHYHLSSDGKTAICGERGVMQSHAPESTWGFRGHLRETYCKKCHLIRFPQKEVSR